MRRLLFSLFIFFSLTGLSYAEDIDPFLDLDLPPGMNVDIQKLQNEYDQKMQNLTSSNKVQKGASNEVVLNQSQYSKNENAQSSKSSRKLPKKKKVKKSKKEKAKFDSATGGYYGTVPSVKNEYKYKGTKTTPVKSDNTSAEEYTPDEFQKAKTDDPLFLNVILNKGAPSKYIADMLVVMRFLESFRPIIEKHEDIQKFNANVNVLDLHARRIEKLYADKPEGMSPTYSMLLDLAYKAKVLGNLKFDANYYAKFSPVQGTEYDPVNLSAKDNELLNELDKTVFAIRQLNN